MERLRHVSDVGTKTPICLLLGMQIALCAMLHTRPARAEDTHGRTSSLSWVRLDGSESCIATNTLAQAVEGRLGRKVFVSASQADVSVEGHIVQTKPGGAPEWRAVLTIRDAHGTLIGTREIERGGSTCSSLDDSIVFVVSVLIDPDAALGKASVAKAPEPPPAPAPPPQVIVRREEVLVPAAAPPEPWHFEASAGGAVSLGLLPTVGWGATASVLVEPPGFWGIELSGTYWHRTSVDAERGARSDVWLAYGGVALCPFRWEKGRLSYRACAGLEIGTIQSRGSGFAEDRADEALALHAFLPSRFELRLAGPLVASLGLSLIVPLVRTELSYGLPDGSKIAIFRPAPIAGATDLSLGLRFP